LLNRGPSAGDEISISPATTVGNFLSGNVLPSGVQLLVSDPTVSGINNSAGGVYTLFNGNWLLNLSTVANNDVLYPGESYILRNTTTTDIDSLVVSGKVPSFNSRIVIGANSSTEQQDVNFSYFSPVSEVIGDAGLQASNGDQILFFNNNQTGINNSGSGVLTYFQGQWLFNLSEDVTNSFTFEGGQGYVYRTAPGTPVGSVFDFTNVALSSTQSATIGDETFFLSPTFTTDVISLDNIAAVSGGIASFLGLPTTGTGIDTNDPFAIFFLSNNFDPVSDTLSSTESVGLITDVSFVLPADGATVSFANVFTGPDPLRLANDITFTVIPEPTSAALLGLGGLALIGRRKRN